MKDILNIFKKPDALELIKSSLADCQRGLVQAEAAAAYNAKMSEYYRESIRRLEKQLQPSKGASHA